MNIGDTYYDFGEHENAIPYFNKAIQLDPDHANAHLLLGLSISSLEPQWTKQGFSIEETLNSSPIIPRRPDQTVAGATS